MIAETRNNFEGLCERDRINRRKFTRWFSAFNVLFLFVILISGPVEGGIKETPLWRLALVLLPLVPGYFAATAYFRFIREADELIRHVVQEAVSKSFAIVIILGFIYFLAAQIFGEWEDSGSILWVIGYLSFLVFFSRAWCRFNV